MKSHFLLLSAIYDVPHVAAFDMGGCTKEMDQLKSFVLTKNGLARVTEFMGQVGKCIEARTKAMYDDTFAAKECLDVYAVVADLPVSSKCQHSQIGLAVSLLIGGNALSWPSRDDMDDAKDLMDVPLVLNTALTQLWPDCGQQNQLPLLHTTTALLTESLAVLLTKGMPCASKMLELGIIAETTPDYDFQKMHCPVECGPPFQAIGKIMNGIDKVLPPRENFTLCPREIDGMRNLTHWLGNTACVKGVPPRSRAYTDFTTGTTTAASSAHSSVLALVVGLLFLSFF